MRTAVNRLDQDFWIGVILLALAMLLSFNLFTWVLAFWVYIPGAIIMMVSRCPLKFKLFSLLLPIVAWRVYVVIAKAFFAGPNSLIDVPNFDGFGIVF